MAIAKDIAIHTTSHMNSCLAYQTRDDKASLEEHPYHPGSDNTDRVFAYATNLDKTIFRLDGDEDILSSGIDCTPDTASILFQQDRELYETLSVTDKRRNVYGTKTDPETGEKIAKKSIEAHHIIQSFEASPDLDPRLVHEIGIEFCKKAFPGHRCVVATHLNTDHLHNHIVMCAYHESGTHKFHMNKTSRHAYRQINDDISREHDLPILLTTNMDRKRNSRTLTEIHKERNTPTGSWKEDIRRAIDKTVEDMSSNPDILTPDSGWKTFVDDLQNKGFTVTDHGSNYTVSYAAPQLNGAIRHVRGTTLGMDYSKPHIIDMSRYTDSGRRRSDLEIMILKLIKKLRELRDLILEPDSSGGKSSYRNYSVRISHLESALKICREKNITSPRELETSLNTAGSKLSHCKKEYRNMQTVDRYAEHVLNLIDNYIRLKETAESMGITSHLEDLTILSAREVQHNRAQLMPMTPAQKRQLYLLLSKHDRYIPQYKYEDIDYVSAASMIDYLSGRGERPDILIDKLERSAVDTDIVKHVQETGQNRSEEIPLLQENHKNDLLQEDHNEITVALKAAASNLLKLGYHPDDLANIRTQMQDIQNTAKLLKNNINIYSTEYRHLKRIQETIDESTILSDQINSNIENKEKQSMDFTSTKYNRNSKYKKKPDIRH